MGHGPASTRGTPRCRRLHRVVAGTVIIGNVVVSAAGALVPVFLLFLRRLFLDKDVAVVVLAVVVTDGRMEKAVDFVVVRRRGGGDTLGLSLSRICRIDTLGRFIPTAQNLLLFRKLTILHLLFFILQNIF